MTFAAPTPDENLVPGWNVQGNTTAGYAQSAVVPPAALFSNQASAGFPNPPGAMNIGAEASASYSQTVLTNPGYADGQNTALGALTAPSVPASTVAATNPSGLAATVTLSGGTTTVISTAPFNVGGASAATFTQVGTTTPATVTVPPAGYIKVTYSVAPTWTWVATN